MAKVTKENLVKWKETKKTWLIATGYPGFMPGREKLVKKQSEFGYTINFSY